MTELIFATGNPNKVTEVQEMLQDARIRVRSLKDIGWLYEIIESGGSLEENARIKAATIYESLRCNVFSEDTGLEVYALDNRPGVHTARYAGEDRDPQKNMEKLLSELHNKDDRGARFKTVISLYWKGTHHQFTGICEGTIGKEILGDGGFGYDPVFIPAGYESTFGQLSSSIKNEISHRKRALNKMLAFLTAEK